MCCNIAWEDKTLHCSQTRLCNIYITSFAPCNTLMRRQEPTLFISPIATTIQYLHYQPCDFNCEHGKTKTLWSHWRDVWMDLGWNYSWIMGKYIIDKHTATVANVLLCCGTENAGSQGLPNWLQRRNCWTEYRHATVTFLCSSCWENLIFSKYNGYRAIWSGDKQGKDRSPRLKFARISFQISINGTTALTVRWITYENVQ